MNSRLYRGQAADYLRKVRAAGSDEAWRFYRNLPRFLGLYGTKNLMPSAYRSQHVLGRFLATASLAAIRWPGGSGGKHHVIFISIAVLHNHACPSLPVA
jgi:hypothetical protein